jgi:hypothetical protein
MAESQECLTLYSRPLLSLPQLVLWMEYSSLLLHCTYGQHLTGRFLIRLSNLFVIKFGYYW